MKRAGSNSWIDLGARGALFGVVLATAMMWSFARAQAPARPAPSVSPRYLEAIRSELAAMRIEHGCETSNAARAHCSFTTQGAESRQSFVVHLVYSDESDTIYLYIAPYLTAPANAPTTPAVLRRLMELNWELLLGKFEWNAENGEIRLAMVLNTDSNFDRRAFRSTVRGIIAVADRYWTPVSRVIGGSSSPPSR